MQKHTRKKARLESALAAAELPLFALDARRRVIFFNKGCEALTGWQAETVLGETCRYATSADPNLVESLTGILCPPAEVFAGAAVRSRVSIVRRGGDVIERVAHFLPLVTAQGEVHGVLGLLFDDATIEPLPIAASVSDLHRELAQLQLALRKRYRFESFVCASEAMLRVARQIRLAADSSDAVFLWGEKGTGKEHVARIIHSQSAQGDRAFIPLECRDLPPFELKRTLKQLLEPTPRAPASADDEFILELLRPGTVFLAHVEALPRDLQEMLIEAYCRPKGQTRPDVRLMAASSADLSQALDSEELLADFYFLITTLSIELPPLRQRHGEIPLLAQAVLDDLNRESERQHSGFADDVWPQFREYRWPGNIDELAAVVAEACAQTSEAVIRAHDLPFRFRSGMDAQSLGPPPVKSLAPLEETLAAVEAQQIRESLRQARQNKSKAAELLGITRPRLYRRMQALGIEDLPEEM